MGVILGLGAALSWGLADYTAARAARTWGVARVVLGFHLLATVALGVTVAADGDLLSLPIARLALFVLVGAVGWLSYLAFYGALAIGPISVLSPIVSGYAVVAALLSVVIGGEHPGVGVIVAVLVTTAGVALASLAAGAPDAAARPERARRGVALAVCAVVLLGAFVYGVSYERRSMGWLVPIFLARGFATAFLAGHALQRGRPPWAALTLKSLPALALLAALDTGGFVSFNLGVGRAATAVVATASAPYALVPILMGVLILHERPSRTQWQGVGLVFAGLMLLGVGQ